jgi:phospholipid/cholesterol/gamma-HCH transport system substrate-binding protein
VSALKGDERSVQTQRARRRKVRVAAAFLAAGCVGAAVVTFLGYEGAFTPTSTITLSAPRAGLVMDRDAKVKFLGVPVGRVTRIAYDGGSAQLTLAIRTRELAKIPANITARIASSTVFGAKSVELVPPAEPSTERLDAHTHLQAADVSVEVNTLFQALVDTLQKIDPVQLNTTLSAIGDGLRDNGDSLGAGLTALGEVLAAVNPHMPELHESVRRLAVVGDIYTAAANDLVSTLGNIPAVSDAITDEADNLSATLLAATGLGYAATDTLAPAEDDMIAAITRLRTPLEVLREYSPEFGCLITSFAKAYKKFGPYIGGIQPALFVNSGFIPGSPAYTYPESLPLVNASGGPNCRGLPDLPTKQGSGSWYRPPFLVTDNAYVPYQPNTELQFDAPSTLQFLFNGAFAERDDY